MSEKVSEFRWTDQKAHAAQLLADGKLTDKEIGKKVGITERQLGRWKLVPEFSARVAAHVENFDANITKTGLALKKNRIRSKRGRAGAFQKVLRGLLSPKLDKRKKPRAPTVDEIDTALRVSDRLSDLEIEIATEMGDWKTKIEHSGKVETESAESRKLRELFSLDELEEIQRRLANENDDSKSPVADG